MNHITKHQGVVDVAMDAFVLVRQVCLACARECLYDLRGRDHDVRLHYHHACLSHFCLYTGVLIVVVHSEVKLILFAEGPDDSDNVTLLDPKLKRPPTNKRHPKQDRALYKASRNGLSVLVHWRTELEFQDCVVVGGPLIKLDFKETIDESLFLKVMFCVCEVRLTGSRIDHRFEEPRRHLLKPLFF